MIAEGFKPVGWVAAVAAAAISCYMLSLQVASERSDLARVERQIIAARQSIRTLQTELGTRGRLQQLERWNSDVLALSAPAAGQFIDSEVTLARFDVNQAPIAVEAPVRMASAQAAPSQPVRPAVRPAIVETKREPSQSIQPLFRRASLTVADPAPASARPAAKPRPQAVQARSASLINERALEEIGAAARAELNGGTGN